jgi:Domain of unknown function (DUF2431)
MAAVTITSSSNGEIEPQSFPLRILTVGDGDLTLSLALVRAYGEQVELTATTLCASSEELLSTYSNSADVIQELLQRNATVLYGVDATKLHLNPCLMSKQEGFDLILFHHPHLGLMSSSRSTDEQHQARRHFVLLAHYCQSAKSLVRREESGARRHDNTKMSTASPCSGYIHVCLAGDQPQTWDLRKAATINGLQLVKTAETNIPFQSVIHQLSRGGMSSLIARDVQEGFSAPRRYRNGKFGSRHFLAKYGYMHRRECTCLL